jgi:colanic acid biosynthesis glycosyl transferase WcaI
VTTGLLTEGPVVSAARVFERVAYRSADRIIVVSDAFARNLIEKGVPRSKLARIYNPSGSSMNGFRRRVAPGRRRLLVMGNIGHSQGLAQVVRSLEESRVLERTDSELRIAGHGVARDEVADEVRSDRVKLLGLVSNEELEAELAGATLGVVTQRSDVLEFNLPSKLMNYMGRGLPVLAVVRAGSETGRLVETSDSGWVADSSRLDALPGILEQALDNPQELRRRGELSRDYAAREFHVDHMVERSEKLLREAIQR